LADRPPLRSAHHGKVVREYLLRRALQLAVLNNVLAANPVRDVQLIRSTSTPTPTGAEALTADQLREPLIKLRVSETCAKSDLVDPIIRRGEADRAPQVAVPGGAIGAPGPTKGQPRPLVAARILAACRARRRAAGPADLPARLDRRFVVTATIRLLSDIAVRAVEELDQRDTGTGKSRLHLPDAFNWTTIAR
jgi:hypothetical protein